MVFNRKPLGYSHQFRTSIISKSDISSFGIRRVCCDLGNDSCTSTFSSYARRIWSISCEIVFHPFAPRTTKICSRYSFIFLLLTGYFVISSRFTINPSSNFGSLGWSGVSNLVLGFVSIPSYFSRTFTVIFGFFTYIPVSILIILPLNIKTRNLIVRRNRFFSICFLRFIDFHSNVRTGIRPS